MPPEPLRTILLIFSLLILAGIWIFTWHMENIDEASEPPLVKTLENISSGKYK